jgi:hypothetical protein
LYEEDARVGHREFDLKLTQRVKMCMVRSQFNFGVLMGFDCLRIGWCTGDVVQFLGCVSSCRFLVFIERLKFVQKIFRERCVFGPLE